jgi:hypothetical protein
VALGLFPDSLAHLAQQGAAHAPVAGIPVRTSPPAVAGR